MWSYEDIRLKVHFSGGLLIGANLIDELYVHMGFHPAWKWRIVLELLLEDGTEVTVADRSSLLSGVRNRVLARGSAGPLPKASDEEVASWIEACFSQTYNW